MVKLPVWLTGLVLATPVTLRKQSSFRAVVAATQGIMLPSHGS